MTQLEIGEYPTAHWLPTHARLPDEGQRIVFMGDKGEQLYGTYLGSAGWERDETEGKKKCIVNYVPVMWKEIPRGE